MKFTKIHSIIIISLVLFSLAGLSAIQFTWLKGAIAIQEKKIQEKLGVVVQKIQQTLEYGPTKKRLLKEFKKHHHTPSKVVAATRVVIDSIADAEQIDMEYGFEMGGCSKEKFTWYSEELLAQNTEKFCELHLNKIKIISPSGKKEHLHLLIFFPQRNQMILQSMSLAIGSSILFMLLLIAIFVYMLRTIYRQKKLSEMKNDFINNLTHEFKTPLASVSLAARTLKRLDPIKSSEKALSYVNLIDQEGKRLDNHIDKILQMAVIDSGNLVLDKQEVDIHEIIKKVKSSLNLMVEKNGGKISLQLSAFQPMIFADALHLFNMIYNLVDNAIKYNQNQPLISINSSGNEQEFQINISDNGIGMTSEVQKHIFDRFFRQPTGDVHNVKGFGLGLAYVKRMMDAHNGHIKLDSQPGKGTTFSLVFPRK
jgi:two-component system phosphate regulon sensor histidine kinase PhoR